MCVYINSNSTLEMPPPRLTPGLNVSVGEKAKLTGLGEVMILKCVCMFVIELGNFPDSQNALPTLAGILEASEFPEDWILKRGNPDYRLRVRPTLCNPRDCSSPSSVHDSPGRNTRVGYYSLLRDYSL